LTCPENGSNRLKGGGQEGENGGGVKRQSTKTTDSHPGLKYARALGTTRLKREKKNEKPPMD